MLMIISLCHNGFSNVYRQRNLDSVLYEKYAPHRTSNRALELVFQKSIIVNIYT